METIFGGAAAIIIFFWVAALVATVFWIWMLVDALMSDLDTNQKLLWFLVIFFLHFIGAIIYFVARKGQHTQSPNVR
jgi:hypothetical protein